jgi:hypothetical protein
MAATDSGFILALLRNNTIVIHSLADLDKSVQTIEIDPSFSPYNLTYSPYGIAIRDLVRDSRMQMSRMLLLGSQVSLDPASTAMARVDTPLVIDITPDIASPPAIASPPIEEPSSGSGLTPPSSPTPFQRQPIAPTRTSSLLKSTAPTPRGGPFSLAVSETLLLGPNGVQSLAPTPVIARVELHCENGMLDQAMALVDEERRKGRRGEIESDKATHQGTLRYLHLLLASHLLAQGTFAKAGDYFAKAKVDPRILVRSFPTLRGKLIGSAEEVEVYHGLKDVLVGMPEIEDIGESGSHPNQLSLTDSDPSIGKAGRGKRDGSSPFRERGDEHALRLSRENPHTASERRGKQGSRFPQARYGQFGPRRCSWQLLIFR